MIRVFYKELLKNDPEVLVEALELSSRVYEFSEFIVDILEINNFGPPDQMVNLGQKVTYHEGCHLRRELDVTTQPKKLITALPGIELRDMEQAEVCCGFGGTFSVKYPDISAAMLQDKLDNIQATGADSVTACDSSCLMQIDGGLKRQNIPIEVTHVAQLIDEILENRDT
jgi:L-lactate dehydrogenase complex protein LldE